MPLKRDPDASHAHKLLRLFSRLFFSDRAFSLTDLASMLGCSKQTVQRLVDDIETSMGVAIEQRIVDGRKLYRMPRQGRLPAVQLLSLDEMQALQMCAKFAQTLLGPVLFDEATKGLEKSTVLLPTERPPSDGHFEALHSGHIDYSPHQGTLRDLIAAMEQKRVCRITYRRLLAHRAKSYRVKPLKIFSYRDTVYLHTRRAKEPDEPWKEPAYHPLLAIHRIEEVEITDQHFEWPRRYDFDRDVQSAFGVWQNEPFRVTVEFDDWAAEYVAERRWSADQELTIGDDGSVRLAFTAKGRPEVLSWILSFGEHARLLEPDDLVDEVRAMARATAELYDQAPSTAASRGSRN